MFLRHLVGKAITQIECCWVEPFTPTLISLGNSPCCCRGDRDDLCAEAINKIGHFLADLTPPGDNERFGHRPR